jgi:hypothetical protein
VPALSDL